MLAARAEVAADAAAAVGHRDDDDGLAVELGRVAQVLQDDLARHPVRDRAARLVG